MYLTLLNLLCLSMYMYIFISGQITYPDMRRSRCGRITEVGLYCIYVQLSISTKHLNLVC